MLSSFGGIPGISFKAGDRSGDLVGCARLLFTAGVDLISKFLRASRLVCEGRDEFDYTSHLLQAAMRDGDGFSDRLVGLVRGVGGTHGELPHLVGSHCEA